MLQKLEKKADGKCPNKTLIRFLFFFVVAKWENGKQFCLNIIISDGSRKTFTK